MQLHYKYTKQYSDSEPLSFEDDVFKIEAPLIYCIGADKPPIAAEKPPIKTQTALILDYVNKNGSN